MTARKEVATGCTQVLAHLNQQQPEWKTAMWLQRHCKALCMWRVPITVIGKNRAKTTKHRRQG